MSAVEPTLVDDCFRTDGRTLRHGEAIALLEARATPVAPLETVAIAEAAGRVLAEAVHASRPVPGYDNAAVDGFAFANRAGAYDVEGGLRVVGRSAAGHPFSGDVPPGSAIRILTGALVPAATDCVVMQEDTSLETRGGVQFVQVPRGVKTGANIRRAGEDVAVGDQLYCEGHLIRPQDVAALASVGRAEVVCRARLRVAIVSSGDEVIRPGSELRLGQVYDANAPMLLALAATTGAHVSDLGVWPDKAEVVEERLADAARRFDIVLTTGGASSGDEDHMVRALSKLGSRHLWRLAIKPGRPLSFGQIGNCVVLGLPGNPVAAFVCFLMYAWPLLRRLAGAPWSEPRRLRLPAAFDFKGRKTGRREFWRGMLVERDGVLMADKFRRDGSGLISSVREADGLIDIPEDHGDVAEGDLVDFIPFSEFGILGR